MRQKKSFVLGVAAMIVLGATDLILTWFLTPDLTGEGNTFVALYGFNWIEIILISIGFIVFVSIPFYFNRCVFNYSHFKNGRNPSIGLIAKNYFLENNNNRYVSIGRAI